ncbi:ACT domain-containing protein [Stutzerimonas azotifigens]|uniref:ACT domain-containing protein n=1 Tax=Stutzerimonas azotifigens TaxID=291995 RepID=UPI0003FD5A60|nr:ACT domain-containing protein [Stutzerimonas azotifigens]
MAAETALDRLLAGMSPCLQPGTYVFCTVPESQPFEPRAIVASIREREGLSLVLGQADADRLGLDYDYLACWITLQVHSSLAAVGLTAAVSGALAEAGISCNLVAGYHHDHLFVPQAEGERALAVLRQLAGTP